MASVQDETKCPQCGARALVEFNCRTLVEVVICFCCGYNARTAPTRRKTKTGKYVLRRTVHAGCGAYRMTAKNGIAQMAVFHTPLTRATIARFKRDTLRGSPQLDASACYLSRWNPRCRKVEMLVGILPKEFLWDETGGAADSAHPAEDEPEVS